VSTLPDSLLRAARRWLEQLPTSSFTRTRALLTSHSSFSDITPTQYAAAYEWLKEAGLIDETGRTVPDGTLQSALFRAAIKETLWLPDADVLISGPDELPEDASRAANMLGINPEDAVAAIRHEWGKFDATIRQHVGSTGERVLVELLATIDTVRVRHVAADSDGYGYDIAMQAPGLAVHLEVKATTRRGRLTIYLSRNEYEAMVRDPAWTLVAIRLDHELQLVALATINRNWVSKAVPIDRQPGARWQSARLEVPAEALVPGLPGVVNALRGSYPSILDGKPCWPG
jgi:Protein NO VEIN, C-terminal